MKKKRTDEEIQIGLLKILTAGTDPCTCGDCKKVGEAVELTGDAICELFEELGVAKDSPQGMLGSFHALVALACSQMSWMVRAAEGRDVDEKLDEEQMVEVIKAVKMTMISNFSKFIRDKFLKIPDGVYGGVMPPDIAEAMKKHAGSKTEGCAAISIGNGSVVDLKVAGMGLDQLPKEAKEAILRELASQMGIGDGYTPAEDSEEIKKAREAFKDDLNKHFWN